MSTILTDEELWSLLKSPEVFALLITGLFLFVKSLFLPKARIEWGVGHSFSHIVPQNDGSELLIATQTVHIKNAGRAAAEKLEIYLNFKPEQFHIWPPRQFETILTHDKRFLIKMDYLEPQKGFDIELLQAKYQLPHLIDIRSINGSAKQIEVMPMRLFPVWFQGLVISWMCMGIYLTIYLLLKLISIAASWPL